MDKRPYPTFVLPRCSQGVNDPGFGKTCWPAPEISENLEQRIGNLGLTDHEEDLIVDFMKTLSDGYTDRNPEQ